MDAHLVSGKSDHRTGEAGSANDENPTTGFSGRGTIATRLSAAREFARDLLCQLRTFPRIPLCFLGLALYRAWIDLVIAGYGEGSAGGVSLSIDLFDIAMVVVLCACSVFARRLAPLFETRWARPCCVVLMVLSTLVVHASFLLGLGAPFFRVVCSVAGGAGAALMILLWSELYASLSPTRICLYYALSLMACVALIFVFEGFKPQWLFPMTALLPVLSMLTLCASHKHGLGHEPRYGSGSCELGDGCVSMASASGPEGDFVSAPEGTVASSVPHGGWASFTFPWKPVIVVAVYAFAYGLQWTGIGGVVSAHSSPGTAMCCLMVAVAIIAFREHVDFGRLYGTWLPFFAATCLILSSFSGIGAWWRGVFSGFGYAAVEIFIMTMIGSISYRRGANAIWLFGIERSVRAVSIFVARYVGSMLLGDTERMVLTAVLVVAATFVVLDERNLDSTWGVSLVKDPRDGSDSSDPAAQKEALALACSQVAQRHGLTQREGEILLLLAQQKSAADIEQELLVANGTAKAHIRHVYQKLGIHSREELYEMVASK